MKLAHSLVLVIPFFLVSVFLVNCASPTAPPTPQDDLVGYTQVLADNGFSGATLIAKDGDVVFSEGYGLADEANKVPNTRETVFDTGSLSKQFTAAAILHLEEQGLLQLTDTLPQFFEHVPAEKANIAVHQLLTHTSGLTPYVYESDFEKMSREEAVQAALDSELELDPGEKYMYSDTGYGLLAAIVEIVSGQAFTEYLHQNLFEPAGMDSTGFYNEQKWADLTVAHGYNNDKDLGSAGSRPGPYWGLLGFGGVLSTVGDLHCWHLALEENSMLSAESTEKLFTPYTDEDNNGESYYGYGWVIMDDPDFGQIIWHDGATDSQNAIFIHAVDHDLFVIVLTNRIDGGGILDEEVFYGSETGFFLGMSFLKGDYSEYPSFVK